MSAVMPMPIDNPDHHGAAAQPAAAWICGSPGAFPVAATGCGASGIG